MANTFTQRLISPTGHSLTAAGLLLDIRLPWYRSLPLSTVEIVTLRIDGTELPSERLQLEVNGRRFPVTALGDLTNEWWFVLDSALLHARVPSLAAGAHLVDLTVNLYPPYIPGLTWVARSERELQAGRGVGP